MIALLYKIVLTSNVAAILAFIVAYTRMAPWWRDPIGRTIVIKDALLVLVLIPSVLSLFLNFNRVTSQIAAWGDLVLLGLITPVMLWRIQVFRQARDKR